jgi:hypothetical protein
MEINGWVGAAVSIAAWQAVWAYRAWARKQQQRAQAEATARAVVDEQHRRMLYGRLAAGLRQLGEQRRR